MSEITVDYMGKIQFIDNDGNEITDYKEIQYIKKNTNWKEIAYKLKMDLYYEICEDIELEHSIHKHSEKIISLDDVENAIRNLKLKAYNPGDYMGYSEKEIEDIAYLQAKQTAENNVERHPFINYKKRFNDYVMSILPEMIDTIKKEELHRKENFKEWQKFAELKNREYKEEYEKAVKKLNSCITQDVDAIINILTGTFNNEKDSCIIEFSERKLIRSQISFIKFEKEIFYFSCFLPPINGAIECREAKINSSNKIIIQNRNSDKIKDAYFTCLCGLILCSASKIFNINVNIERIVLICYYAYLDDSTGNYAEEHFCTSLFFRETFKNFNMEYLDPVKAVLNSSIDGNEDEEESENNSGGESSIFPIVFDDGSVESIVNCLSTIMTMNNPEIFYVRNLKKFTNLCADIIPEKEYERHFLRELSEMGILEKLINGISENVGNQILFIYIKYDSKGTYLKDIYEKLSEIFSTDD